MPWRRLSVKEMDMAKKPSKFTLVILCTFVFLLTFGTAKVTRGGAVFVSRGAVFVSTGPCLESSSTVGEWKKCRTIAGCIRGNKAPLISLIWVNTHARVLFSGQSVQVSTWSSSTGVHGVAIRFNPDGTSISRKADKYCT
jgi:hypothetical protein